MGEVIRKTAATADILADARAAQAKAMARPGTAYLEGAETHLSSVLQLIEGVESELAEAEAAELPLVNALEVADENADAVIGRNADLVWNLIGRPQTDMAYTVLFPGGVAGYAGGDVLEQPMRMEQLARLLRSGIHPKLPAEAAETAAAEVEAAAAALDEAVEAIRRPRTRVKLLQLTRASLGRTAAIGLARMKRFLRNQGLTETQIHDVIPDRSRPKPKAKAPAPAEA